MLKRLLFVCGLLWLVVFACKETENNSIDIEQFKQYIAWHTSGSLSSSGEIKILLKVEVPGANNGQILEESPFIFDPPIEGQAHWTNSRKLLFTPKTKLPQGVEYSARFKLGSLVEVPKGLEEYEFSFSTQEQTLKIELDGLSNYGVDSPWQYLEGKLSTLDIANPESVQQVLQAELENRPLKIFWSESSQGRLFHFRVDSVCRKEDTRQITLAWDGKAIGAKESGNRDVEVPGLNDFRILNVKASNENGQQILVRFSDPLATDQDLKGLVRTEPSRMLETTIEGNLLRVEQQKVWNGEVTLVVEQGLINKHGYKLKQASSTKLRFSEPKPTVKILGTGTIVPDRDNLTLPLEVVNLHTVFIKAWLIQENNIQQFLQVNELDGESEIHRVGNPVWSDTVSLGLSIDDHLDKMRVGLDLNPLLAKHKPGLYHLEIGFDQYCTWLDCDGLAFSQELGSEIYSGNPTTIEYWEQKKKAASEFRPWRNWWENKEEPCHPAYYWSSWNSQEWNSLRQKVERNLLISNLGMIAKQDKNGMCRVFVTDLLTTEELSGVKVSAFNFQNELLETVRTDSQGMAIFGQNQSPKIILATKSGQHGYLKLNSGSSLALSSFDVGGTTQKKGLKGFVFTERGAWRPGDSLFVSFILDDRQNSLPQGHPISCKIYNARSQLQQTITRYHNESGFYDFKTNTSPDAITGTWKAVIEVGGQKFTKSLIIETLMPNRLKLELEFAQEHLLLSDSRLQADLEVSWLTGSPARNLKADLKLKTKSVETTFAGFPGYTFTSAINKFHSEEFTIFDKKVDIRGRARIDTRVNIRQKVPGRLQAIINARVFEPGGAFSTRQFSIPCDPYSQYVGLKFPENESGLETGKEHEIQLAAVSWDGYPTPKDNLTLQVYKLDWNWWWERNNQDLARYINSSSTIPLYEEQVDITDGKGSWSFKVADRAWGNYLLVVSDPDGGHSAAKTVFIDWPGWVGRSRQGGSSATMLKLTADADEYEPGETALLTIPTPSEGRLLLSLENSSEVLDSRWIDAVKGTTRVEIPLKDDYAPNIYAHVILLQPHANTANDLPIRMYGVLPLSVIDPKTSLKPQLTLPDKFIPGEVNEILIAEENGRPMSYTLAIVDEGLLDLTNFSTPDAWQHFYQKEALGVNTMDLFDQVAGAYGGALETILAVGGGGALANEIEQERANRFPPMVLFEGPMHLADSEKKVHRLKFPDYLGSVRVMVVAAEDGAFGSIDATARVSSPLMLLGTLPRELKINEELELPVSVFAIDEGLGRIEVKVETDALLTMQGNPNQILNIDEPGDKLVRFRLNVGQVEGVTRVKISAKNGSQSASQFIELRVSNPNLEETNIFAFDLDAGKEWTENLSLQGLPGTNKLKLEVSRVPPINLESRLNYLIRYPHGCIEQVTSAVFPQIYLTKLLSISPEQQGRVEENIKQAIKRMRSFRTWEGGFSYWPGGRAVNDWASLYAGHFLLAAAQAGYQVPEDLLNGWQQYEGRQANKLVTIAKSEILLQSYRLYLLAMGGSPQLGAMNRLREKIEKSNTAVWRLAAAYQLSGRLDAARELAGKGSFELDSKTGYKRNFGSRLRNQAMILEAMLVTGKENVGGLVRQIQQELSAQKWLSTQTTAYSLIALARYYGVDEEQEFGFTYSWNESPSKTATTLKHLLQIELPVDNLEAVFRLKNENDFMLYPRLIATGKPAQSKQTEGANGFALKHHYETLDGEKMDINNVEQGVDFRVVIEIKNTENSNSGEHLALTFMAASGWEIRNERLLGESEKNEYVEYQDFRDDRAMFYLHLPPWESTEIKLSLNAAYGGKSYYPGMQIEDMYDNTFFARFPGKWVNVGVEEAE
jgi:alpha-2-macroglobulin